MTDDKFFDSRSQKPSPADVFSEAAGRANDGAALSREDCLKALTPFLTGEARPSEAKYGWPDSVILGAGQRLSTADLRTIRDLALARLNEDIITGDGNQVQFFTNAAISSSDQIKSRTITQGAGPLDTGALMASGTSE